MRRFRRITQSRWHEQGIRPQMSAGDSAPPVFDAPFQNKLLDLFMWRRDVRWFRPTPVAAATLDQLLEIACFAPSVGFSQPWRFVTVEDTARRVAVRRNFEVCNAMALACQDTGRADSYARLKLAGLDQAPCQLAVFAEPDPKEGHGLGRKTMPETAAYSAVRAMHTLWLAARAAGMGFGWVSILDPQAMHAILDVPTNWVFIGYCCLGYPAAEHGSPELEREGWERRRNARDMRLRR
jgi:5,6-dimethylbenzimidazole synthase